MMTQDLSFRPLNLVLLPVLALVAGIVLSLAVLPQAKAYDVPLIIVPHDEDRATLKRSSDSFKQFVSHLATALKKMGFALVDQTTLLADMGWTNQDRLPLVQQVDVLRNTTNHGLKVGIRGVMTLRMKAIAFEMSGLKRVRFYVDSKVLSYSYLQHIDTIDLPKFEISVGLQCDARCISEELRKSFPEVAHHLATLLARVLAPLLDEAAADQRGTSDVKTPTSSSSLSHTPDAVTFIVSLREFSRTDTLQIINTMADEFPGYQYHDLISLNSFEAKYVYSTNAPSLKLMSWFTVLLNDMGFEESAVSVEFSNSEVLIENLSAKSATTQ